MQETDAQNLQSVVDFLVANQVTVWNLIIYDKSNYILLVFYIRLVVCKQATAMLQAAYTMARISFGSNTPIHTPIHTHLHTKTRTNTLIHCEGVQLFLSCSCHLYIKICL